MIPSSVKEDVRQSKSLLRWPEDFAASKKRNAIDSLGTVTG
jgi:hypothetical protein